MGWLTNPVSIQTVDLIGLSSQAHRPSPGYLKDVPLDVSLAIHYSTHPSFPLLYFPPSPLPSVSFSLFWNVVCSSLLPSLSSDCSFSSTLFMLFDYRVPSVIWISLINKLQYCFSTVCGRKKHSTATLQQHYTNWPKRVTVITVEEMSLPTDPRFAQDMNGLYFQWWFILTVRDRISKRKSRKSHFKKDKNWFAFHRVKWVFNPLPTIKNSGSHSSLALR